MRIDRSLILASVILTGFVTGCSGGGNSSTTTTETQTSAGGTANASAAPSAAAAGGPLEIVPMRIVGTGENMVGHAIVLRADGAIAADDRVLGRIEGSRVLGADGQPVFEVSADGHLTIPGHGAGPELTAEGALVMPDGQIVVNPDGTVEERRTGGDTRPAPFHFENLPANARRTAVVVVAFITMATSGPSVAPPTATAGAQAELAPATAEASPAPASAAPASAAPTGRHPRRGH